MILFFLLGLKFILNKYKYNSHYNAEKILLVFTNPPYAPYKSASLVHLHENN